MGAPLRGAPKTHAPSVGKPERLAHGWVRLPLRWPRAGARRFPECRWSARSV
ncbi:hypothetical protein J121_797 [Qipengyuania citrea LAMA 915]|uniref:Uncharacterized protein n=1 Tax=Qipengyuania citrea LAMA 915 TaxID=1306953 RepID=A0A0L1KC80_9SPHN|nr:hypothetical protein J121_797 [Qipengyuania citrea LAMA 915]